MTIGEGLLKHAEAMRTVQLESIEILCKDGRQNGRYDLESMQAAVESAVRWDEQCDWLEGAISSELARGAECKPKEDEQL